MKLRKNTRAADTMVDQAVQDVQDVLLEPLQDVSRLRRRRAPLPPQATKCYPSKARSYLLSLGNVLFPFYNPGFAVGIGLLYWFITWQFQSLVSTEEISLGKIDKLGIETSLWEVLPLMPLYLLQGMITSVGLTALLGGPLSRRSSGTSMPSTGPGFRRYATKVVVGTVHFLAHLVAMFTLSLLVVTLNNKMSPSIERYVASLNQTKDQQPTAIKESLETLQRKADRREQARPGIPTPTPVRQIVGFTSYPILMVVLGALVGGSLWGFYWVLTGLARMHADDAFAALRIKDYKNFLRLKFEPTRLTIYPLGIDKVPGPDDWLNAPRSGDNPHPNNPKLVAARPIDVRSDRNADRDRAPGPEGGIGRGSNQPRQPRDALFDLRLARQRVAQPQRVARRPS